MQETLAPCFRATLTKPKFRVQIPVMPSSLSLFSLSLSQLELRPLFHCRLTQDYNDEEEHPNHFVKDSHLSLLNLQFGIAISK